MKQHILCFCLLLSTQFCFANSNRIEKILNSTIDTIAKVDTNAKDNRVYLHNSFSYPAILNPQDIRKIKALVIYRIDLVYTCYKNKPSFNQRSFNKKRLLSLQKLFPEAINNHLIEWRLVAQKEATDLITAKKLFHGFVIHYRQAGSKEQTLKEIEYINTLIADKSTGSSASSSKRSSKTDTKDKILSKDETAFKKNTSGISQREVPCFKTRLKDLEDYLNAHISFGINGKVYFNFTVSKTGEIKDVRCINKTGNSTEIDAISALQSMPKWKPGKEKGKEVDYSYTLPIQSKKNKIEICSELYTSTLTLVEPLNSEVETEPQPKLDSTILKVFERNTQWQKMLIVCDATGSMSPYTVQLLLWLKSSLSEKQSKATCYTFFNDGDKKNDTEKVIGKTGGIYSCKASGLEEVKNLLFKTMQEGYGGDIPENNLEATLEALNQCPACGDVIMIADNYATPRDLYLFSKLNNPLHIILCGTTGGVNAVYLNLALKTKGSIHTTTKDISFATEPSEGKRFAIGNEIFVFVNGKIVRE